jgi:CRP-like cAMP-binding protein
VTFLPTLRYVDIFYGLRSEHLEQIDSICREVVLDRDTMVFDENSRGDEMYIVTRGAVDILVDPAILGLDLASSPTTVATLRKGQVFGEVVLVDQGLRSAGASVAVDGTALLVIGRDELIALCEQDYELGYLLMRNIAADMAFKIRGADLMVREQLLWQPGSRRQQEK